jgi:uncharacterized cupredoxin-like copper-binding protein
MMNKPEVHRSSGASFVLIVVALAAAIALVLGLYVLGRPRGGEVEVRADAGTLDRAAADVPDTLEIVVEMDEFFYSPEPIRLPAGRPVKLIIRNLGGAEHEFMAGREVENGTFEYDLFAGIPVRIEGAAMSMGMMGEGVAEDEHAAKEAEGVAHAHEDADEGHEDAAPDDGHEGGGHGTMVLVEPGETAYMMFTIPADRKGEWTAACFVPGHYEFGMYVDLIVE